MRSALHCHCLKPPKSSDSYPDLTDSDPSFTFEIDKYQKLKDIRDHPARERRRSSAIPRHLSIAEDQILERVCYETEEEPEVGADVLSRNKRKEFVRRLSVKIFREETEVDHMDGHHNGHHNDPSDIQEQFEEEEYEYNENSYGEFAHPNPKVEVSVTSHNSVTGRRSTAYGIRQSHRVSRKDFSNNDRLREFVDETINGTNVQMLEGGPNDKIKPANSILRSLSAVKSGLSNMMAPDSVGQELKKSSHSIQNQTKYGVGAALTADNYKARSETSMTNIPTPRLTRNSDAEIHYDDYENDQAWFIAAKRLEKFRNNSISSCTKPMIMPDTIVDNSNKENWVNLHKTIPKTIGTLEIDQNKRSKMGLVMGQRETQNELMQPMTKIDEKDSQAEPEKSNQGYNPDESESAYKEGYNNDFLENNPGSSMDEANDFAMYSKQAEGRRESIAMTDLNSFNQTTLTGSSQYPLPGTRIDITKGGTYTTTRSANNLISQEEFLYEVSQARKKLNDKLKKDKAERDAVEEKFVSVERRSQGNRDSRGSRNSKTRTNSMGRRSNLE